MALTNVSGSSVSGRTDAQTVLPLHSFYWRLKPLHGELPKLLFYSTEVWKVLLHFERIFKKRVSLKKITRFTFTTPKWNGLAPSTGLAGGRVSVHMGQPGTMPRFYCL